MEHSFELVMSIAAVTYSVGFGIVAKKVWDVPKLVEEKLNSFSSKLEKKQEIMQEEVDMAHKRLSIHDRISSKMIEHEFDSKAIVESGNFPEMKHS